MQTNKLYNELTLEEYVKSIWRYDFIREYYRNNRDLADSLSDLQDEMAALANEDEMKKAKKSKNPLMYAQYLMQNVFLNVDAKAAIEITALQMITLEDYFSLDEVIEMCKLYERIY